MHIHVCIYKYTCTRRWRLVMFILSIIDCCCARSFASRFAAFVLSLGLTCTSPLQVAVGDCW